MKTFILVLGIVVVVVVFRGCVDLLADQQKQNQKLNQKPLVEVIEDNSFVIIRERKHRKYYLCEDGLEYIILSQIKVLAFAPHWIVKDGIQQIKTCK